MPHLRRGCSQTEPKMRSSPKLNCKCWPLTIFQSIKRQLNSSISHTRNESFKSKQYNIFLYERKKKESTIDWRLHIVRCFKLLFFPRFKIFIFNGRGGGVGGISYGGFLESTKWKESWGRGSRQNKSNVSVSL